MCSLGYRCEFAWLQGQCVSRTFRLHSLFVQPYVALYQTLRYPPSFDVVPLRFQVSFSSLFTKYKRKPWVFERDLRYVKSIDICKVITETRYINSLWSFYIFLFIFVLRICWYISTIPVPTRELIDDFCIITLKPNKSLCSLA